MNPDPNETVNLDDQGGEPVASEGLPSRRYEDLGLIGSGGMGEVRRVRDLTLSRVMAMKILREAHAGNQRVVARFVEEARVEAQLQHPGIPPVHELGWLPDGRPYFTMQEVRGRTLTAVIAEVHAARRGQVWASSGSGWTLHRLIDAFVDVCDAAGYAHARGVVHRDLKPDNVMIGEHGEVIVLDWGLAKVLGAALTEGSDETTRAASASETRMGTVSGTPAYMSPEQARGDVRAVDARSDVYALGGVLYEILAGAPPPRDAGDEAPFDPNAPDELISLCRTALSPLQSDRPADGTEMAMEARAWLEGARRREKALEVVALAQRLGPEADRLRAHAARQRDAAAQLLAGVPPWAGEAEKAGGWALEDEARHADAQAKLLGLRAEGLLQAALTHAPDLPDAHAALAARYLALHAAAEAEGAADAATAAEIRLREHVSKLAPSVPERARAVAWLEGDGALTLHTDPPGAEVTLCRYREVHRRLVPTEPMALGRTPLHAQVPMGSYLCHIRLPGHEPVRYPVHIGRGERWDGLAPGDAAPTPVRLPPTGTLGPDDCYVPAGWFWSGEPRAGGQANAKQRLWADGLVVRRFPVTNAEYIAFLDDLVVHGREADALRLAPRQEAGTAGEAGALIYGRTADGRFVLRPDAEGDLWLLDWPVFQVDWGCAVEYARWEAARTGAAWRLPAELEWEKAARGVDGRLCPWGDFADPSWCRIANSEPGRTLPAPVDSYTVDESPYGVRGMAGNVMDWCADRFRRAPAILDRRAVVPIIPEGDPDLSPQNQRARRGGFWSGSLGHVASAYRHGVEPNARNASIGFRLVRSFPP